MKLHTDFFEKLHEKFPTITEDAVIEGFYKFLKDITIESNIEYPSEIDISSVTGTSIKFTDTHGNTIGIIEPVKKENFNHGIQLRVDDQVLGLFVSDEHIATAIAPTPVPMHQGGNPKSIVTLDSFKQLAIYTLEELGLSFTEDGFLEIDKGDDSLSSVGYVKQQLDKLKQEIIAMIPTNDEIVRLAALPRGSIIIWTSKDIPNGWAICDGANGTPDMRDKFIIGASNNRDINVIGSHGVSLEGSGLSFYSVYYIMKINGNATETPKPPTPPTPETPDYTTPEGVVEGVLSPYTLKIRFKNKSWYREPGRFSVYNDKTKKWKAATKIVGDVVYFVFTEEEAIFTREEAFSNVWGFRKHPPMPFQSLGPTNCTHILYGRNLLFVDTIMDDVVTIDDDIYDTDHIDDTTYVNVGSAYI